MSEKLYFEDIICARATPQGPSAIAIIRVSGKKSWDILKEIFNPFNKKTIQFTTHHIYYGNILENQQIIDTVVILTFKDGFSFTGEESFEINCHGSEIIVSLIIKLLLSKNVRLAQPGEFSKRAFLNGKINLTQAEAIMDVVNASTSKSAQIAVQQLSGRLTDEIGQVKEKLADLLANIEVFIDYPEEDIDVDAKIWINQIIDINSKLEILLKGFNRGKFFREGIQVAILGKTNSGKSTLFNFLLNDDKAIVSDIHGTTRDYIDALINIEGYGVRLFDTAGLRETDDPIEKEGTRRSKELSERSDIILYLVGSDAGFDNDDKNNISNLSNDKKIIIVVNKIDKTQDGGEGICNEINDYLDLQKINYKIVKMSALQKKGLNDFNSNFVALLVGEKSAENDDPVLTNVRHANLIEEAHINMVNAFEKIDSGLLDLVAFEIREALNKLGEITGEITPQDILNRIFSNFCVGK